jgi:uncharacterized protein (DUF2249 family)
MSIPTLDARVHQEENKDKIIIEAFDSLELGEQLLFINNNDSNTLFNQLEDQRFGKFEWEYIEEGPERWKVLLAKKYLNYI